MIQTETLSKSFPLEGSHVLAVDCVTLSVSAGEIAAITGESGSGKSTLLSLLGTLARSTSGTLRVLGKDVNECSNAERARLRRRIGFVFQSFSLLPRLRVWENVSYPLIPQGLTPAERFGIASQVLERVGLGRQLESRPEQLSGGEQQRVAVARALAVSPEIVLADEPTSNLDARSAAHLIELFQDIYAAGVPVVLATHDARLIKIATRVYEMHDGVLRCV